MKHYKKISIRKRNTKRNTKNKSKKQSLWKMKGCANMIGGCGCGVNNVMTGGCGCGAQVNTIMSGGTQCANDILAYPNNYRCVDNLAFSGKGGNRGNPLAAKRTHSQSQFIDDHLLLLGGSGTCNSNNMPSGASYPSGAMGYPWEPNASTWPGVAGVQGASNYLAYNNYSYPQADRMLINTEAIPFKYGGKSKKHTFRKHMRKHKTNKTNTKKHNKNKKYQKGGLPSLGILTDFKNTWNSLRGNNQLPSPLPFKDQLENQAQQQELNM